jgi:hypothetical protein
MEELFSSVQDSLDWANSAVADAQAVLADFFNGKESFTRVIDFDRKTGENVAKLRMVGAIPSDFQRRTTEALTLTRHSFDRSLNAAIKALGRGKERNFPWSCNPTKDLQSKLFNTKKQVELIPRELWDIIRSHEPYPTGDNYAGGDDLVRQMAHYANRKHSVGYVVRGSISSFVYPSFIANNSSTGSMKMLLPAWNPVANEAELFRYKGIKPEIGNNCRFTFTVCFDADPPLGQESSLEALVIFIRKAECVLNSVRVFAGAIKK